MGEALVRPARFEDIPTLAYFRRLMFEDMAAHEQREYAPEELYLMEAVFGEYARAHLGEELQAWVVEIDRGIVACAAVSIVSGVPSPGGLDMQRALIHNMHTLEEYRRRGYARQLVDLAVEWCRGEGFASVSLNASDAGRPLYEKLGFKPTNQMMLKF